MKEAIGFLVLVFSVTGCVGNFSGSRNQNIAEEACLEKGQEIEFMVAANDVVTMKCVAP